MVGWLGSAHKLLARLQARPHQLRRPADQVAASCQHHRHLQLALQAPELAGAQRHRHRVDAGRHHTRPGHLQRLQRRHRRRLHVGPPEGAIGGGRSRLRRQLAVHRVVVAGHPGGRERLHRCPRVRPRVDQRHPVVVERQKRDTADRGHGQHPTGDDEQPARRSPWPLPLDASCAGHRGSVPQPRCRSTRSSNTRPRARSIDCTRTTIASPSR